jgi:hypothetical protein
VENVGLFFRSFRSLYYDRSIASTKRAFQTVLTIASSFKFQYSFLSLRPSSSCLRLFPSLIIHYIFPSVPCFRRQFLSKIWTIRLTFLPSFFICHVTCSFFPRVYDKVTYFFTRSVQLISILLQDDTLYLSKHFPSIILYSRLNYSLRRTSITSEATKEFWLPSTALYR